MNDTLPHPSNPPHEASRWLMAAVTILGMAAWWWSGYRSWGSMLTSFVLMMALWMLHRIITRESHVEGNPFYLMLVGPLMLLAYHHMNAEMRNDDPTTMTGAMDVSLIFQFNLLAAGAMLSQHLLPRLANNLLGVGACSVAILTGAGSALVSAKSLSGTPVHAWALSGFAGVTMALLGVFEFKHLNAATSSRRRPREWRIVLGVFAVLGAALIIGVSPRESLLGGAMIGVALLACGIVFKRWRLLVLGLLLGAGSVTAMKILHAAFTIFPDRRCSLFGEGGKALLDMAPPVAGTLVLARTMGWVGLGAVGLGLLICAFLFLAAARRLPQERQLRAILWLIIASLGLGAMLAPGGLFVPSVMMLVAFTAGMLPTVVEMKCKPRPGWLVLVAFAVLAVQLGVARNMGLGEWCVRSFHLSPNEDKILHGAVGLLLAIGLAWIFCRRHWSWGVVGIVIAGLAGGLGELLQSLTSYRSPDAMDWLAHATGSAVALPFFLLCLPWRTTVSAAGSTPVSPTPPRKKLAILSRYALMVICWLVVLGCTAIFAYCMPTPREVRSKIMVPDFLSAPVEGRNFRGYNNFPDPENTAVVGLYSSEHSHKKNLNPIHSFLWMKLDNLTLGDHTIQIKAIPYGPVAWRSYTAMVRVVGPQRPVYLIDTDMVLNLSAQRRLSLQQLIKALRTSGEVALYCEGDLFNFERVFLEFQKVRSQTPLLYDYLPGKMLATLANTARRLDRNPLGSKIYVITDNATLANLTARAGFTTCLYRPIDRHLATTLPSNAPALKEFAAFPEISEYLLNLK